LGGAGFMRENKRCSFREVEDGFNVVMEKGDGCCSFVYLEELGYYISYACPFFSIREYIRKVKCNSINQI
jgi:hypothetical protein